MIYLPIAFFTFLIARIKAYKRGAIKRMQLEEVIGFLFVLWYSPLLQSVGKMFGCYEDIDRGWVLTADPAVSCAVSTSRMITNFHAVAICTVVGFGLPATILWQTLRLRDAGKLRAGSPLASVFE